MATITPTQTRPPTGSNQSSVDVIVTTWAAITESDTCAAVEVPGYADETVQFVGTFGGATAVFQGSNDATNYVTLTDPLGNNISTTSAAMKAILQNPLWVKPSASGGTGQSLTVILVSKR